MRSAPATVLLVLAVTIAMAGCLDDGDREAPDAVDDNATTHPGFGNGTSGEGDVPDPADPEGEAEPREPPDIALEEVASGLELPTLATNAGDGTGRLFVLEQSGRVRVVEDGQLREEPYLDLTDRIPSGEDRGFEQGLLGLAFHPDFADNGRLYVSFTNRAGDSKLLGYTVDDPASDRPSGDGEEVFSLDQPHHYHNGGHVAFGPEGYLYYGLGDGGPGGDPDDQAQNATTLHGSVLRLDVSGEVVRAPPDNPFVGDEEGHELVWAYGLRNPWRFSFDRATGDLYIADVGEATIEEVNHQPADSEGGENYGWNRWEGNQTFNGDPGRDGFAFPAITYVTEGDRCAVTGGYAYRGQAIPDLQGFYLYADFCTGTIWAAQNTTQGWQNQTLLETDQRITSFGEDEAGEVYIVGRGGAVHRLVEG